MSATEEIVAALFGIVAVGVMLAGWILGPRIRERRAKKGDDSGPDFGIIP